MLICTTNSEIFWEEINTLNQHGHTKLIKHDSKDIHSVTNVLYLFCNIISLYLLNFPFIEVSEKY